MGNSPEISMSVRTSLFLAGEDRRGWFGKRIAIFVREVPGKLKEKMPSAKRNWLKTC